MEEWLPANPIFAGMISIILNILIAIAGVLPSAFVTVWTVGTFQFHIALAILIAGEALGAIVSFILYRMGLRKLKLDNRLKNNFLRRLKNTKGTDAIFLIIFLRLLPFIPSGLVTMTAAFSKMKLLPFSIASTIGKIPALFIEAYSVYHILNLSAKIQMGLILAILLAYTAYKKYKKNPLSGNK